jgi:hypothetical protein
MKISLRVSTVLLALTAFQLFASSPGEGTSTSNTWVNAGEDKDNFKFLSSLIYAPATDEFLMWGTGGANVLSKHFDVESFDLRTNLWHDSFPKGKESAWANAQFPSWVWYGQGAQNAGSRLVKGAAEGKVADHLFGGYASFNQVDFVETESIVRPTRCPTFHQLCYDTKRNRVIYFLGGKTFTYDPKERAWTDLKPAKVPLGCEALAYASLCYDPINDQAVLFGGGMALNNLGGAKTWQYDCAKNEWTRREYKIEPPLRCNTRMIYDSHNKLIVLFGGDDQTRGLNDTWIYDVVKHEWSERKPQTAPPPCFDCAATYIEKHGVVMVCIGDDQTKLGTAWIYNAASNVWVPLKGTIPSVSGQGSWLSCDYSSKDDVVVLSVTGSSWWDTPRRTFTYRLDPATGIDKRAGSPPGTYAWKHDDQRKSLAAAPPGDRKTNEEKLKKLPANIWYDADPPGVATSKTWSDCTFDTDKGVVLYYGGGHSAYSGSDVAHYDVGENRWSLSYDPEFPPYLESTNRTVFGWAYNVHPWSEHTRRWYAYDPVSKMMVYCRQGGELKGRTLFLGKDGKKTVSPTGAETWIYDPAKRKFYEPAFDRPWGTEDATCLVTTPRGVYALNDGKLWICKVEKQGTGDDEIYVGKWTHIADKGPLATSELDPTLFDSKRNRLISLVHGKTGSEMWYFDFASSAWSKGTYKGEFTPTRTACYVPTEDVIFQTTFGVEGAKTMTQVFRCATNEWINSDIAFPKKGVGIAGWDTSMAYDPVHNLIVMLNTLGCGAPSTVFLLRYNDKTAGPVSASK